MKEVERDKESRELGIWILATLEDHAFSDIEEAMDQRRETDKLECIAELKSAMFPLEEKTLLEIYSVIERFGKSGLTAGNLREIAFETLRVVVHWDEKDFSLPIVLIAAPRLQQPSLLHALGKQILKLFRDRNMREYQRDKRQGRLRKHDTYLETIYLALKTQDESREWKGGVLPMTEDSGEEKKDTRFVQVPWQVDFANKKDPDEEDDEYGYM